MKLFRFKCSSFAFMAVLAGVFIATSALPADAVAKGGKKGKARLIKMEKKADKKAGKAAKFSKKAESAQAKADAMKAKAEKAKVPKVKKAFEAKAAKFEKKAAKFSTMAAKFGVSKEATEERATNLVERIETRKKMKLAIRQELSAGRDAERAQRYNAEIEQHALRAAKIDRLSAIAAEGKNAKLQKRVEAIRQKEDARHEKALTKMAARKAKAEAKAEVKEEIAKAADEAKAEETVEGKEETEK